MANLAVRSRNCFVRCCFVQWYLSLRSPGRQSSVVWCAIDGYPIKGRRDLNSNHAVRSWDGFVLLSAALRRTLRYCNGKSNAAMGCPECCCWRIIPSGSGVNWHHAAASRNCSLPYSFWWYSFVLCGMFLFCKALLVWWVNSINRRRNFIEIAPSVHGIVVRCTLLTSGVQSSDLKFFAGYFAGVLLTVIPSVGGKIWR